MKHFVSSLLLASLAAFSTQAFSADDPVILAELTCKIAVDSVELTTATCARTDQDLGSAYCSAKLSGPKGTEYTYALGLEKTDPAASLRVLATSAETRITAIESTADAGCLLLESCMKFSVRDQSVSLAFDVANAETKEKQRHAFECTYSTK